MTAVRTIDVLLQSHILQKSVLFGRTHVVTRAGHGGFVRVKPMDLFTNPVADLPSNTLAIFSESALAEIDAHFENRLDCVKLLDGQGRLLRINACGVSALEIADPSHAVGTNYFDFWSGIDQAAALDAAEVARRTGSGRFTGTYVSPSGNRSIWDEVLTLLRARDGTEAGFLVVSRDVTRLRASLLKQEATAELGMLALGTQSFQHIIDVIVERLSVELHCPLTKVLQFADEADELTLVAGVGWKDGLVGCGKVGVDRDSQAGFTLMSDGPVIVEDLETETRFTGPPLLREHGVRSGMSVIIPGPGNRPFGVLGVHSRELRKFDRSDVEFLVTVASIIASRWRQEVAEARNRALLREMAHRSGNLLQVVNSIFSNTMRGARDIDEGKTKFAQRLSAMARANLLLARGGWSATPLRDLAESTLEPFGGNIKFKGRDVVVPGDVAFDLSLIFFELGTNSSKYGAFGPGEGEVHLSWSLTRDGGDRCLKLQWLDTSEPSRREALGSGFGTRLIHQLVELEYQGKVSISEKPQYCCAFEFSLPQSEEFATFFIDQPVSGAPKVSQDLSAASTARPWPLSNGP
jgi:two-component sensor histidine kinase